MSVQSESLFSCLTILLDVIPRGSLDQHATLELYPVIIKRLDDSFDDIRLGACRAFMVFIRAANSKEFKTHAVEYCVEQLLVHLDDHSAQIQEAVCNTLCLVISFSKFAVATIIIKVKQVKASHRDPTLCDIILEQASRLV